MLEISRKLVLKKLAIAFPDPAIANQVLEILDRYGKRDSERVADAVHLAIIKLSQGEVWRVRELVQKARRDFRDVLFPAQAPEAFRLLRENPPKFWGGLTRHKPPKESKRIAMQERDHHQWIEWLSS